MSSVICHQQILNRGYNANIYVILIDKLLVVLSCLNVFVHSLNSQTTLWNWFICQIGVCLFYGGVLIFYDCPHEDKFCPQIYMHICMHIFAMFGFISV